MEAQGGKELFLYFNMPLYLCLLCQGCNIFKKFTFFNINKIIEIIFHQLQLNFAFRLKIRISFAENNSIFISIIYLMHI